MLLVPQKYVYIRTFGCQMNEHDSERILLLLQAKGYVSTDSPSKADLILFNTCTVREKAHHKAMSEIGRSKVYKKNRSNLIIGVCGCVAQEEKGAIFERYPHVDLIFGPDQILKLPELIEEALEGKHAAALDLINDPFAYKFLNFDNLRATPRLRSGQASGPSASLGASERSLGFARGKRATAFVSIMKGCNCSCSYCIVPSVRGREVCREPDSIIKEVQQLAAAGTREVVLLGQNVNAYRNEISFPELLRRIAEETPVDRIRFTSPHPRDVKKDLIREYAENIKLMPHIHLPLQAGSNAVLKRMRRGYTREHYIDIVSALRSEREGMAITTDLIVGFCGETKRDFEDTLDLMKIARFESSFAFKYSPRPGTVAALKFTDDVPQEEKEERLSLVLKAQLENSRNANESIVGRIFPVLTTGFDKMGGGLITGRIPDNRIVHFAGNESCIGNIVPVRITKAHANSVGGEAIDGK